MKLSVLFTIRNTTKGTVRYEEIKGDETLRAVIGGLYINKRDISEPYPKILRVDVTDDVGNIPTP